MTAQSLYSLTDRGETTTYTAIIMPSASTIIVSKCTVYPQQKSSMETLKLSVSDLPMLSCHYIQKGVLLTLPPCSFHDLIISLKHSLSITLNHFPALAGRLITDSHGYVHINCNAAGVDFIHAEAKHLSIQKIFVDPTGTDIPSCFREFFAFDKTISYLGHGQPLVAVQVTEIGDGVFIGCTVNHAVTDGTSFWCFFNTFAEICKGVNKISNTPDFTRDTAFHSMAVLKLPAGGPKVTFSVEEPLREKIFHFSRESIVRLKRGANETKVLTQKTTRNDFPKFSEILENWKNDSWKTIPNLLTYDMQIKKKVIEISSFQSLCAQLWRSVTRARNLDPSKTSTFRIAVNCRHRLDPPMDSYYFGNAIQSIPTYAEVGELLSHDLNWCADRLHRNVVAHDDATVRCGIANWEEDPRLFPLGNADGASITMGSSPRFPMYNNDFGWGRPLAIRSGGANKFDGKISAFPGREGNGSVDLEVILAPETMAGLENDREFMQYVTKTIM